MLLIEHREDPRRRAGGRLDRVVEPGETARIIRRWGEVEQPADMELAHDVDGGGGAELGLVEPP